jgi:hypothetical protein
MVWNGLEWSGKVWNTGESRKEREEWENATWVSDWFGLVRNGVERFGCRN